MINKIKSFVRKHRFLRKILYVFHFKLFFYDLLYRHKAIKNIPFKYQLPDGDFIRLYPQGQIAKPLYAGGFEREEVRLFFAVLKPGMHIVDVGANIGLYSIIACKKLKERGRIWAFEPSSENYKRLLKNLFLNKRSNDLVTPVNLGLGNKDNEELSLRRDTGYGDAERYILPDNKLPSEESPIIKEQVESENVNLTTLDSFMCKINNSRVDFMKMDTEGYEYFGLQGARKILASNPNMVFMLECNELGTQRAGHTPQDVYDILNEFGFCCFYWDSEQQSWGKDRAALLKAGNIWACHSVEQLPSL
jgi:FkbM family methyltransferase